MRIFPALGILGAILAASLPARAEGLAKGFVHLRTVDPTIVQDMRYATANNFTGHVVPGYLAGECILARPVAEALARVQADLKADGLTLSTFDCYRPAKAVRAFVIWAKVRGTPDPAYYPDVARNQLISKGYIAARSGHSTGGSIDLTLAKLSGGRAQPLDMGTGFDFFDPKSHTAASKIPAEAAKNRKRLVAAMARRGFSNYSREWWHFRYTAEPFRGKAFDFDVTAAP